MGNVGGVANGGAERAVELNQKAQKKEASKKSPLENESKAIDEVLSKLKAFELAVKDLDEQDEVLLRKTGVGITEDPVISALADDTALRGATEFQITQLATKSTRDGAADVGLKLSSTADVSGVTISTMPVGTAVTAGTFSVNGSQITLTTTDSLADVLTAISTATGGDVTGAYNPTTDMIDLSSAGTITLGSAGDTSNFLTSMKLYGNGTNAVSSESQLGTVTLYSILDSANLATTPTSGSFSINGYSFSYDVTTDNLQDLMSQVNSSDAGVNMSYDSILDKFMLTNKVTGSMDVAVEDTSGDLLESLGLNSSSTLTTGVNAQFKVNGGVTRTSPTNTITSAQHGVAGVTVTAIKVGTDSVTVSQDSTAIRTKVDNFISKFNELQSYIADNTKITVSGADVIKGTLTDNREVGSMSIEFRKKIYNEVTSLAGGTIKRLADIGIDFKTDSASYKNMSNELYVKDETVLTTALENNGLTVAKLFTDSTDGLSTSLKTYLEAVMKNDGPDLTQKSALYARKENLGKKMAIIDENVAKLQKDNDRFLQRLKDDQLQIELAQEKMRQATAQLANLGRA